MGKSMKTGFTSSSRSGPLAPTNTNTSMPQGVYGGPAPVDRGKLVRKGHSKDSDAMDMGKANRKGVLERQGPKMRIEIPLYPARAPEASHTQANGRILPSFPKMRDGWSSGDFQDARTGRV